ncbi:Sugar phosphate permease [Nocardioides alpinus]|uniref:MFS transporter n=1 Tax=Nocardioides alpinus TaxID=748909 RepID=A0A1I0VSQ4_9ACTN|nr:MFS transporter [Nocardioides alpinus]PKH37431.1 MFS transporter [Nocardioides alpinus]SFA78950.1 Sugar phosphate permease [Nocardioides alpinus]
MYISVRDRPATGEESRSGTTVTTPPVGRVVIILGVVSLLTDVSSESVSAILPLYLTLVVGLTPVAYGLIDGLYQGVSALVRLGGGWVADATDRPKWVAFLGYGLSAVARVFLLFASGAAGIAAVVTADRIGKGIRTAPRDAMISTSTPAEHLGRAFGVHRMLDTIGAALGPLIAFGILVLVPDGYSVVLVVSLAFALAGVALLGLLGPDVRSRREAAAQSGPTPPPFRWRDLTDRRLRPLLVIAGVLGLLTVGDGFIYLALLDHGGVNVSWFPLFYVGTNLAYLLLAVPVGRLADRVGRARILVVGHLALVGAYLCAVLPTSTAAATIGTLALLGTFYAATDGVIAALAGRLVPVQARTSGIAAAQTVVALARMLASAGFGLMWLLLGPATAMIVVAGLLAVAILAAASRVRLLDTAEVTP